MAANVYLNSFVMKHLSDWTPLAATPVVATATINARRYGFALDDSRLLIRYRGGPPYVMPIMSLLCFQGDGVDLSELEVKYSNQAARVFVFGQSRA